MFAIMLLLSFNQCFPLAMIALKAVRNDPVFGNFLVFFDEYLTSTAR